MASDLNQILPVAASTLIPPTPTPVAVAQRTAATSQQKVSEITQIAAAEAANKGVQNDKERGVPVPKKSEAGFSQQDSSRDDSHDNKGKRLKLKA